MIPDQLRHSNYLRHINSDIVTELACKYTKPLYKTQNSEFLVDYEEGFDMNTRKIIIQPMATTHSITDKKYYVLVQFPKNTGRTVEK